MSTQNNSKVMNIVLWIVQILLAVVFIMAGMMKTFQPIEVIGESLPWVMNVSSSLVRFIGISELAGGIGLILPALLRIKPSLTVWAAIGLAVVMVLASGFHAMRGEFSSIGVNIVFIALTAFVAWGRSKKAVILPRN